ncbi:S-layer homology domain-containing protein [Desulforamulus hydrothermalis]|uniref:S-layer domain protein n=1 Tax=Desulforamulus hydrothermalis Lam5 = DSM 18033 TaxID=1121428 RepID=K8EHI9_9FIRM|nr:S-layer homology domain-containing protein [Desulforamulus hydrothermalis]CCO08106.1 S-layer domain protein [Desulforamulus hydrothermalis Lam5 = DSM 18033]SHG81884.1 S-layer homology domain-containing protein [Desulforamulus hydrothermalis Lam5 = DSM 18033]
MLIKIWRLMITLVLVLGILAPAWAASPYLFKDTSGKWWEQAVAECSAAELVGGRGNGIFAPKDSVTQVEAIIFLNRALGHRKEADSYGMSQGGYNFPAGFPAWAQRNVAFAADKGYISKTGIPSIQPKKPASRAEIAVLFANALKLSADGYQLDFKDKGAIPAGFQPYVAAAVKHGIMAGRTDNTFDPNANVTRAEMAAIIARLVENGKINPQPDRYFIARLTAVDATGKKITVSKGGQNYTWSMANEALLYRAGKRCQLGDFKAGEYVKVVLDTAGKIAYLAFSAGNDAGSSVSVTTGYTGTIRGLAAGGQPTLSFQPDGGSLTSWPLASSVKISQYGQARDLTALTVGARAEIKVTNGNITEIYLLSSLPAGNESRGYVINVYLDYFTVRYDDGTSEEINKSAVSGTFYQLVRGQRVALTKTGNTVTAVVPLNEPKKLFGEVVSVGSTNITIEDGDDYELTIELASGYKVKDKVGSSINLSDIDDGDAVAIELNSQNKASVIQLSEYASSTSGLAGEVLEVDNTGSWSIRIEQTDGTKKTFNVASSVDVYKDGGSIDFEDIRTGYYVKLKLNSSDDVSRIDVMDYEVLEGEVTELDVSGNWSITIEKDDGDEETYDVSSQVDVYEDGSSKEFDDINEGDYVRLVINNDEDEVIIIAISDESGNNGNYTGTITKLDMDDDEITIKRSGTSKTYDLASNVIVEKDDDDDLDLEDILIGSVVKISLEDNEVEKIEITDDEDITVEGELKDARGSYIILRQDNGDHKLYFADDVELEDEDGDDIDADDLSDFEGEDVVIKLDNGEISSLEIQ